MQVTTVVNKKWANKLNSTQTTIGPKGAKVISSIQKGKLYVRQGCWNDTKRQNQNIGDLALKHSMTIKQCLDVLAGRGVAVNLR